MINDVLKLIGIDMVSLNICKEYLNVITFKIPLLLQMNWTFWCIDCIFVSSYTGVTNFWKWSSFWFTLYYITKNMLTWTWY